MVSVYTVTFCCKKTTQTNQHTFHIFCLTHPELHRVPQAVQGTWLLYLVVLTRTSEQFLWERSSALSLRAPAHIIE